MNEHHDVGEFTVQLFGWAQARRFVVVRERVRESKAAVGRRLIDVPGYTFRVWVTNRNQSPLELWRDYNGRACIEQRIEELKHDLAADGFCLQPFFATESAFLAVLCTFNLLSLYQHQTTPDAPYRQPGTLRVAVFLCGAVLGVMGRDVVVKLSAAWGGLSKHKPLVDATLNWLNCTSPKLIPPEDRQAIGGVMILNFGPQPQKSALYFGVRVEGGQDPHRPRGGAGAEGGGLNPGPDARNRSARMNGKALSLKIEAIGDFAYRKIKPRIRLSGHWLEQAGFRPGHRVEISSPKAGELTLQFKEECPG